jgi:NADH dehydrogenase
MKGPNGKRARVVIVGGGFGGVAAAKHLKHAPVDVTLIDRNNHQVFQPLLYQAATSALDSANIGYPLRRIFRRQKNVEVLMDEVDSIDPAAQTVHMGSGDSLAYDYLIVATGMQTSYFAHPEWEPNAPGLKSIVDAIKIRERVLIACERAEQEHDPERKRAEMTFVVVGGGPTGVELAGAVAELTRHALKHDFHHLDPSSARVLLVEAGPALLAAFPVELRAKAVKQLTQLGVEVRTSSMVHTVDEESVQIGDERIPTRVVMWAAGVHGTPLARSLGVELDRHGLVPVTPTLNLPGHANVFVIGDLAALVSNGKPVPGVAPAAIQEGHFAARAIEHDLNGTPTQPFRYRNKGMLATIGRRRAVAYLPGRLKLSGFLASMMYFTVHLFYLTGVSARIHVFFSWWWSFFTSARGARLIPQPVMEKRALPAHVEPPSPPRVVQPPAPAPQPHA